MIKTQIQIPEDLYRDLKNLAKRKEWSLAETLRRGGESLLQQYADAGPASPPGDWSPPTSRRVGWKGLRAEQLKQAAMEDEDSRL
jgi:hypothetical protein